MEVQFVLNFFEDFHDKIIFNQEPLGILSTNAECRLCSTSGPLKCNSLGWAWDLESRTSS